MSVIKKLQTKQHFGLVIFTHQGFCVYEALAHLGMITCILTARRPVYNESLHCSND